jgi:hypothetical protein
MKKLLITLVLFLAQLNAKTSSVKKDDTTFIYKGYYVDDSIITDIIKSNKTVGEIKAALLNTNYFSEVNISDNGKNTISITVKEFPILRSVKMNVDGCPAIPLDRFLTQAGIVAKESQNKPNQSATRLTPEKISYLLEALRQTYNGVFLLDDIDIDIKMKEKNGVADLLIKVKAIRGNELRHTIFYGNKNISTRRLKKCVNLKKIALLVINKNSLDNQNLQMTKNNLERLGKSKGYYDFKVTSVTIERIKGAECLVVCVDEGSQYKVKEVSVKNYSEEIANKLNKLMRVHGNNSIFNQELVDETRENIIRELARLNLNNYDVSYDIKKDEKNHTLSVRFLIKQPENPRKINRISITNSSYIKDKTILDRFPLKEGDTVSDSALEIASNIVSSSPCLSKCTGTKSPSKTDPNKDDVKLDIEESRISLKLAFRLASQTGLEFPFSIVDSNLLGKGTTFSLDAVISPSTGDSSFWDYFQNASIGASLKKDKLFGSDTSGFVNFSFGRKRLNDYSFFNDITLVDALKTWVSKSKNPTVDQFIEKMKKDSGVAKDASAKQADFVDASKLSGISWSDYSDSIRMNEFKISVGAGLNFKLNDNNALLTSITINHRDIKISDGSDERDFREIRDGDKSPDKDKETKVDEQEIIVGKKNEMITRRGFKPDGVECNRKSDKKAIDEGKTIRSVYSGFGKLPRFYDSLPKSKEEFIPKVSYKFQTSSLMEDSLFMSDISTSAVLGTTNALKFTVDTSFEKRFDDFIILGLSLSAGKMFGQCWLDNFTTKDLNGPFSRIGPVEMYSFNSLGGQNFFSLSASAGIVAYDDHKLTITPKVKFSLGSLWGSGIDPMRIPDVLVKSDPKKARDWDKDMLDISQNNMTIIPVGSIGLDIKLGPLNFGIALNKKLGDGSDLNCVSALDFSISIG